MKRTGGPVQPQAPMTRREAVLRVGGAVGGAMAIAAGSFLLHRRGLAERPRDDALPGLPSFAALDAGPRPKLVIARGPSAARNVRAAVERAGGIGSFVKKGERVVLKPNVAWDRMPAQAACTNPEVVAELVRLCRDAGASEVVVAEVTVNDPERCFLRSGIRAAAEAAGARIHIPRDDEFRRVAVNGQILTRWPVLDVLFKAQRVINVPIVKHHSLSSVTIGLKNWYGILGGARNQLHQGVDASISDLATLVRPTLTVVDATRVLVRNGPTGGSLSDVRQENAVAVGTDPVALDAWGASLLGHRADALGFLMQAVAQGVGTADFKSLAPVELTVPA